MIERHTSVDKIEVVENGFVQVRTSTIVKENNQIIAQSFHRHVIAPGDDYSAEDARVQAICAVTHTEDVINAYKQSLGV